MYTFIVNEYYSTLLVCNIIKCYKQKMSRYFNNYFTGNFTLHDRGSQKPILAKKTSRAYTEGYFVSKIHSLIKFKITVQDFIVF